MLTIILCYQFKQAARNKYGELERILRHTKRKEQVREQYIHMLLSVLEIRINVPDFPKRLIKKCDYDSNH